MGEGRAGWAVNVGLTVMRLVGLLSCSQGLLEGGESFVEGHQVGGCVPRCRRDGTRGRRHL